MAVESFRTELTAEMVHQGLETDYVQIALRALDTVMVNYDVQLKEANIVPYNYGVPKLLEYYLVSKQIEGLSPQTLQNKKYLLENFFRMVPKDPREIVAVDIRGYLYNYQDSMKVDNRTLEWHRTTLNAFFAWAYEEEYIGHNPMLKIKPIKFEKKEREGISPLEMEYIRKGCKTLRDRCFIELLYSTGARISELTGLTKDRVDLPNATVHLHGKGNKDRPSYLTAKAILAYNDYMAIRGADDDCPYVIAGERKDKDGNWHQLTRSAAERIVKSAVEHAKEMGCTFSKPVTPHIIRHTTAQTLLDHGMRIEQVSEILGHERLETTKIYVKVDKDEVKRNHQKYLN